MKADVDEKSGGLKADLSERSSTAPSGVGASIMRSRLFFKYTFLFVTVVVLALVASGGFEVRFSYQEHKNSLISIQEQQAAAAADKIEEFITQIESQVGWTTQLPWTDGTLDQRRFDALRLLRQVPAITELAQIDAAGREQLKVSRLTMDVVGSGIDYSHKPEFTQAVAHKVYYGPVYFRRESEPYMTLSLAGTRRDTGVSIAQVNLKLIWDVVSKIKVGAHGRAYVVDSDGRLIAHPDISLVLRNTDMSRLDQVRGARAGSATEAVQEADDIGGHKVLTAYAPVNPLGWFVFVETPIEEAYAPLYQSLERMGYVLLGALALAFIAGMFLAGRMVVPIQALRAGAARIGSGDLAQRITIKSGDEVEALANQFNDMAGKLQESYADLEKKVEQRTAELSESLEQQTAISEILRVISNSPNDLRPVLNSVAENAARICEAQYTDIFIIEDDVLRVVAGFGEIGRPVDEPFPLDRSTIVGRSVMDRQPVHVEDVQQAGDEFARGRQLAKRFGHHTTLAVPLIREGHALGAIAIRRTDVRPFEQKHITLLSTFADQAAIAIENVRLFEAEQQRTRELSESLEQQTATAEVLKIISRSTFDLQLVLNTLVESVARLCDADMVSIRRPKALGFLHVATRGVPREYSEYMQNHPIEAGRGTVAGRVLLEGKPVHVADVQTDPEYTMTAISQRAGFHTFLGVPLMREGNPIGIIILGRTAVRPFADKQIELATTFADQAVIAIENVRLFEEIQEKSRQVEEASKHKSQFLANMSHELRTPLNAILGYAELVLDGIYGDAPEKMRNVLERIQTNGKHLLGLINDVLDLSKIEAGQLVLSLNDYSIKDMMQGVYVAVEPLAGNKKLNFKLEVPPDLPPARGDERRLSQVLLNLVGNAIKFTDTGEVAIKASTANGSYTVAVRDTGPGIAEADQAKIFEEFQQSESTHTKAKGGTGLGLAIAKRIVEMHGGRLWVESTLGNGATFFFTVPLRVEHTVKA
ncbi:MAG TPA: GAF domain-containing protein [Xanthobacteraceae bacterium]|jgi:signal transduction histidine kinase|nr:GAF domain-containing protein [Xanthobacteraceae bacterium]